MKVSLRPAIERFAGLFYSKVDMDQSWMQKIAAMLSGGKPATQPGAQQAAQGLSGRAYQLYAAEALQNGQTPVSPQQFAAGQMQAPQPPMPAVQEAAPAPFRF